MIPHLKAGKLLLCVMISMRLTTASECFRASIKAYKKYENRFKKRKTDITGKNKYRNRNKMSLITRENLR